jgi:hypothetical protein
MRFPRNGSAAANAILVFAGALLGTTLTWWLAPGGGSNDTFAPLASANGPETRSSARGPALKPRADGSGIPKSPDHGSASEESTGLERAEKFRNAGANAARRNLQAALTEAAGISSRADQLEFYRGLYSVWTASDPLAALDFAQANFPAGQLLSDTIGIAMNKWADKDPRGAWVWADQHLAGPLKDRALTDLMIGWSRRSPQQAADWLTSTGLTSQPLFNALATTWAETDPTAAAKWAAALPAGHARDTAVVGVAGAWAANDPKAAADHYSSELAKGKDLNLAIAIADVWATTDPAATAKWLAELPEGATKNEAAATLATVWAASDIRAAVAWSESISDADTRRQVIAHIGTTWGAIEPVAALEWLNSLPTAQATDGVTGALYSWAGTDPVGMQDWVNQSAAGSLTDRARQSLGDVVTETNPPDALSLALGMNSEIARNETLARYFREWRKRDDAAAQDWLQTHWSILPATAQTQLATVQGKAVQPK